MAWFRLRCTVESPGRLPEQDSFLHGRDRVMGVRLTPFRAGTPGYGQWGE